VLERETLRKTIRWLEDEHANLRSQLARREVELELGPRDEGQA
jgi:hypothetical protein